MQNVKTEWQKETRSDPDTALCDPLERNAQAGIDSPKADVKKTSLWRMVLKYAYPLQCSNTKRRIVGYEIVSSTWELY